MPFGATAQNVAPEALLLSRIKAKVAHDFSRLPDYTCVETIQRFHRPPSAGANLGLRDTVRLEVLYSGRKEFYGSPGDREFTEEHPSRLVASGMVGNGNFGLHLKSIFLDGGARFTYRGEEERAGRLTFRYDFILPRMWSGYTIDVSGGSGRVGLTGSFWVDPQTLDLLRVETAADEIPPFLPVKTATTSADYARVRLGAADVLAVQRGEVHMQEDTGEERLNRLEFTRCRLFEAQSAMRFEAPAEGALSSAAAATRAPERAVPALLLVTVALTSEIKEGDAVGTLIAGRVVGDVRRRGKVEIPSGSVVRGRIRQLEQTHEKGWYALGLEFTEIDVGGKPMRFYADVERVEGGRPGEVFLGKRPVMDVKAPTLPGGEHVDPARPGGLRVWREQRAEMRFPEVPGVASLFLRGDRLRIPKPFRLVWRTRSLLHGM